MAEKATVKSETTNYILHHSTVNRCGVDTTCKAIASVPTVMLNFSENKKAREVRIVIIDAKNVEMS